MFNRAFLMLVALLATAGAAAGQDELKQMPAGGVSIFYPPAFEAQAARVAEIARKSIAPSVDVHRQIAALLGDLDAVAGNVADLLGAPEKQDECAEMLGRYRLRSQALVRCFANIRIVRKADAVATKGIDAGALQVRYDQERDEFAMGLDLEGLDESRLKRSYFPVLVNSDGSIRSEDKLAEMAAGFLGTGEVLALVPVYDTVGYLLAEELKLYQPFIRWFNEGVSGWVTRQVATRFDRTLGTMAQELLAVSETSRSVRDRVNLFAWPQKPFQNRREPYFDPVLEAAHTQYAVELITEALGRDGPRVLPKVMADLNYNTGANTETICAAFQKAAGVDLKSKLMEYVPADVRAGIDSGRAAELIEQARKLAEDKQWAQAVDKLRAALQMTPEDVNARLNLAWLLREAGERTDSEIQVFLSARLLTKGHYSFSLFEGSVEGNYVLGRLAILLGNLEYARKFLDTVLAIKPDHADAKRAMDEIRALEGALRGSG